MPKPKTNRRKPAETTKAAIGVAGYVKPAFVKQNEFLEAYAELEPDPAVYRREIFDGRTHTVFPAVLAVEGVLNDALVPGDELERSVPAWNGRPVVLLHPEERGLPISASAYPDVFERRIGTLFATSFVDKRLKAELWLDDQKMDHLAASDLVASMLTGEIVEVSTGYFSDDVIETGEYEGKPYGMRHTNLRPDHLALLPGQVGACSIADGCGAPRVNRSRGLGVKVKEALSILSKAVGIHTNGCSCQECQHMNKLEAVKADFRKLNLIANAAFLGAANAALELEGEKELKVNKALESKHLKMLEDMDEGQLDMMSAMIQAYKSTDPAAAVDEPIDEPIDDNGELSRAMKGNRGKGRPIQLTTNELNELIANASKKAVAEALKTELPNAAKRQEVVAKLKANKANPFTDEQLSTLPVDALERTEVALRPADFTGIGGFSVHGAADDEEPLALTTNARQAEAKKARDARRGRQSH